MFQWALENWAADKYEVLVFYKGTLSDEDRKLTQTLTDQSRNISANAEVKLVNVDAAMTPEVEEQWVLQEGATLPWLVLQFPMAQSNAPYVWTGPLNEETISTLLDSPVRQKIAAELADMKTAVWVLLESGDAEADAKAAKAIEEALVATRKSVEIVPLDGDTNEAAEPVTWDLSYTTVRLNRNDAKEAAFVQMLLHTESDLVDIELPMAFPMFGRGRALYALVGGGINTAMIEEANVYISDRCGCEVKDQNPGVDMLLSMDWDAVVGTLEREPLAPPSPTALAEVVVQGDPQMATRKGVEQSLAPITSPEEIAQREAMMKPLRNALMVLAVVLLLVGVGTVIQFNRNKMDR